MLTLSLMVAIDGWTGQGAGAGRGRGARARPGPDPGPGGPGAGPVAGLLAGGSRGARDLSNTLRLLAEVGVARRQSITCLILTYNTHEKRNPNIGMTAMPTPTAARIIRWSRMWFVK